MNRQNIEPIDAAHLLEHGAPREGAAQTLNRRLYAQLQVFTECESLDGVQAILEEFGVEGVLYKDLNNPYGFGVLLLHEDPSWFTSKGRELFAQEPFRACVHCSEMTMFGRTYGTGREPDLADWLIEKPKRAALDPKWRWAVWYPLRRKPEFALLEPAEQGKILFEHAVLGMAYGQAGVATDIRLASYGLDVDDNEFVLGLVAKELHPLSFLVQDMRKTQQTAKYIDNLGPFFIGEVQWQSPLRHRGLA